MSKKPFMSKKTSKEVIMNTSEVIMIPPKQEEGGLNFVTINSLSPSNSLRASNIYVMIYANVEFNFAKKGDFHFF